MGGGVSVSGLGKGVVITSASGRRGGVKALAQIVDPWRGREYALRKEDARALLAS